MWLVVAEQLAAYAIGLARQFIKPKWTEKKHFPTWHMHFNTP